MRVQVAVALMQAMQLQAGRSAAEQAQAFAQQLHGAWGVGRAGCDDGVLLLLSVQDRQARSISQTIHMRLGEKEARLS